MDFKTSKFLGGIGALLMFIGAILLFIDFFAFGIAEIVGVIFVLISLYGLASFYKDRRVFNNALFGVLASIIGVIISSVAMAIVVLSSLNDFLYQMFPSWNGDIATLPELIPNTNLDLTALTAFFTGLLLVLVVFWVFTIIAAIFVRKSLKDLAAHSGTGLFATVGILLLIGAMLTILLLGILLMWLATLVLAIAFFTMKEPEPTPPPTTVPSPTYT